MALTQAVNAMRAGQCDAAVVAGTQLMLSPVFALQFQRLGMLSPQGKCRTFDANGEHSVAVAAPTQSAR
jgi:fatty acid synthase, animal type